MRDSLRIGLLAMVLVALPGCASRTPSSPATGPAPEESRKLGAFVYVEDGTDLVFTVGVRVTALHAEDAFIPLEISAANRAKGTKWTVTRESFTLVDSKGRRYGLPSSQELAAGYKKRSFDSRLFESRAVTAGKHVGFLQVESSFFPDPSAALSRGPTTVSGEGGVSRPSRSLNPIERLEVPFRSFIEDVLYFPRPDGPLVGARFLLEFAPGGLEEPVLVAFRIPEVGGKTR